jgi:hypothetical protein
VNHEKRCDVGPIRVEFNVKAGVNRYQPLRNPPQRRRRGGAL